MTDIKKLKERLAGIRNEANDYEVESMMNRVKSPLSKKVPFGKENRTPAKIRDDSLDRAIIEGEASMQKKKIRPPKPRRRDFSRIISAKEKLSKLRESIDERKIIEEHKHSIVFKTSKLGVYRAASLESQSGKFAKYWLLNAKQTNGNGWGIAQHTAAENMKKFIGRPLVVTAQSWHDKPSEYGESYEHPYLPTNDMNQIFAHQERFRVGNIVDVYEDKNGDWYASIEMKPKYAMKNLPPFCSPAIFQLDVNEREGQISKWEALHLAALTENPAYGARIALLKGTCIGTKNSCTIQFKGAKQLEAGYFNPQDKENDDNDLVRSNQIHFNPGEKERTHKLESYILRSPNKKGRRVNQNQYRKYGDQEAEANKDYTRKDIPINPSIYPAGHKITTYLKRRLAGLNKKYIPNTPKEEDDEDNYEQIKEERERRFKIDVDRHIMRGQIVCPKKLKERLSKLKFASHGEENMTYQDSKKTKVKKKFLKARVGNGKIAFNSITDTRNGIQQDVEILRSQLREIEQSGYTPAVGMFNGSLEATRVLSPTTDREALDDLQEHQRSTAILDANTELRILDNPKFREN